MGHTYIHKLTPFLDPIYNQETGGWFGDDPKARKKAYAGLRESMPQAGPAWTPEMRQMFGGAQTLLGKEPGAGWENTQYYKALQNQISQQGERMGLRAGAGQAAAGTLSSGAYGAGRRAQNERQRAVLDATVQASGQAQSQKERVDLQRFDQALRGAGFAMGVKDADFRRQYMAWMQEKGLTLGEIEANMSAIDRALGLGVGLVEAGVSIYDTLSGGAMTPEQQSLAAELK